MLALILAALLGLARLFWAPADTTLLLLDWALLVAGTIQILIPTMTSKGAADDTDSIRASDLSIRDRWADSQVDRAA